MGQEGWLWQATNITQQRRRLQVSDSETILAAQDFVVRELQERSPLTIEAASWVQARLDAETGVYRLVIQSGGEKLVFPFYRDELMRGREPRKWEKELRDHIEEILAELTH
jgi:hypothetical protein